MSQLPVDKPDNPLPPAVPVRRRAQRKRIEELTTANAKRAGPKPSNVPYRPYNPIEGEMPPLAPEEVMVESSFKYDSHHTGRRYNSVALHGAVDYHFNADDYPATDKYRARLESDGIDTVDYGADEQELRERHALQRVIQPPEAIDAFRDDIRNPEMIKRLRSEIIRPAQLPKQVLYEQARPQVTQAVVEKAAALMSARDADKFTALPNYNMPAQLALSTAETARAAQEQIFREILQQLDAELAQLPPEALDARDRLLEERKMLALDIDDSHNVAPVAAPAPPPAALHDTHQVSVDDARELLNLDPLALLPVDLRGNFMSVPELSDVWRLLAPLMYQDEEHREHFNAVELVRAMSRRGAKFDGCVRLACTARLGALLDASVFGALVDERGCMRGGHEHYDDTSTTLLVFKFFVVRRSKTNIALLGRALEQQTNDNRAQSSADAERRKAEAAKFMNLNERGLLDLDNVLETTESDGTEPEGTLHSIRYLSREFMFCVRIVCVEPTLLDYPPAPIAYPSESDEPGATCAQVEFFERDDDLGDDMAQLDHFVHSDDEEEAQHLARYKRSTRPSVPSADLKITKPAAEACVGKWKADAFALMCNTHIINQLCVRTFAFYSEKQPSDKT